jgi:hypothetical protein
MSLTKGQKVYIRATVLHVTGEKVKVQIAAKGGVVVGVLAPSDEVEPGQETTPILDFQETTPILD